MAERFEDPWVYALEGPWRPELERAMRPCHYCGNPAPMTEPGKTWKAHKVCALGNPSKGPLGYGDREDHDHSEPRAVGCGTPAPGQTSGKACAGLGTELSCKLCPDSPTWWRNS